MSYLGGACATIGFKFTPLPGGRIRIAPTWRPGRVYIERPLFVGTVVPNDSSVTLSGRISAGGRWFSRIYFSGTAVAMAAALIIWSTAALGLRHRRIDDPGASLLLVPAFLIAIGLVVIRAGHVDASRQKVDLKRFLEALGHGLAPT